MRGATDVLFGTIQHRKPIVLDKTAAGSSAAANAVVEENFLRYQRMPKRIERNRDGGVVRRNVFALRLQGEPVLDGHRGVSTKPQQWGEQPRQTDAAD